MFVQFATTERWRAETYLQPQIGKTITKEGMEVILSLVDKKWIRVGDPMIYGSCPIFLNEDGKGKLDEINSLIKPHLLKS